VSLVQVSPQQLAMLMKSNHFILWTSVSLTIIICQYGTEY
jgi:hypothetical protein